MAERLGRGLQNLVRRFNSASRLKIAYPEFCRRARVAEWYTRST